MRDPSPPRHARSPTGGGFLMVVALIVGLALGMVFRQPTLGFLGGIATGVVIVAALWWRDRRRGVD